MTEREWIGIEPTHSGADSAENKPFPESSAGGATKYATKTPGKPAAGELADPDLAAVADAWPMLAEHVRAAVLTLVRASMPGQ